MLYPIKQNESFKYISKIAIQTVVQIFFVTTIIVIFRQLYLSLAHLP